MYCEACDRLHRLKVGTLPVFTAGVHGWRLSHPWTRAPVHTTSSRASKTSTVNTGCEHGPWARSSRNDTRVHGPCSRSTFLTPVAVLKKALHANAFFQHGPWTRAVFKRLSTLPVFTGRVHARERVVWTGARAHGPWTQPVFTGRKHGRLPTSVCSGL